VVTEHDIRPGAWYLDCGRIPTCIAVEAGQADLFLSGFLGIDFQTRGRSMYRLLDATICFHRGLPGAGEVIRYDILIERFFRQGDTWLFKFAFEATVNGEPLLTMTDGCAGFFSQAELAGGKGIVRTALDLRSVAGKRAADWEEFVAIGVESYSDEQLDALRAGDLAACFGDSFAGLPLTNPVTLPAGRMRLVHRIAHLDPGGGRFGLGLVRGEADIHPDDWFLTCHFVDDRVMPGTLMFECCLHTLRVFLLRIGWIAEDGQVILEPVPGVASQLKCRGQVLDTTKRVVYEISIKDIGYRPEPYVIADALMYADGKPIVEIINMSLRYAGVTREAIRSLWAATEAPVRKPALFGHASILAFAVGKPSEAFGEPYRIFDEGRIIARLPGPPYQFMDRVTEIRAEPWKILPGGEIEAQYDVPTDAWYFADNRQGDMPFAVMLEIALQPCGWLAAYMGSALTSEVDVFFRNLGGGATQFAPVFPGSGTLSTRVKLTRASSSAGMIIQFFDCEVRAGRQLIYQGDTYFGFFPKIALAKQEGLKDVRRYQAAAQELSRSRSLSFPQTAPFPRDRLHLLDRIECWVPNGGPKALGFVRATRRVDPDEWFFKAHFFQDPVIPGSLGLESFLQLLKFMSVERWGNPEGVRNETVVMHERHEWTYRGQVIPTDSEVTVEAVVTELDEERRLLRADGTLSVDGRVIYSMKDFTVQQFSP
jgi:3-hydroxymyristoyl/3-hydroxydecanoyl-(acyl carrier protein) dehydratase